MLSYLPFQKQLSFCCECPSALDRRAGAAHAILCPMQSYRRAGAAHAILRPTQSYASSTPDTPHDSPLCLPWEQSEALDSDSAFTATVASAAIFSAAALVAASAASLAATLAAAPSLAALWTVPVRPRTRPSRHHPGALDSLHPAAAAAAVAARTGGGVGRRRAAVPPRRRGRLRALCGGALAAVTARRDEGA